VANSKAILWGFSGIKLLLLCSVSGLCKKEVIVKLPYR
jgi:hypothetical protein